MFAANCSLSCAIVILPGSRAEGLPSVDALLQGGNIPEAGAAACGVHSATEYVSCMIDQKQHAVHHKEAIH